MEARRKSVDYSKRFRKDLQKSSVKIRKAFLKRRELFNADPFSPLLRNHKLTGKYHGCRSINITGDWRAVYKETSARILFIAIGTHSKLYKQ